jgi:hypothetical protein
MPRKIVTDRPATTGKPKLKLLRLANVKHVFVNAQVRTRSPRAQLS